MLRFCDLKQDDNPILNLMKVAHSERLFTVELQDTMDTSSQRSFHDSNGREELGSLFVSLVKAQFTKFYLYTTELSMPHPSNHFITVPGQR